LNLDCTNRIIPRNFVTQICCPVPRTISLWYDIRDNPMCLAPLQPQVIAVRIIKSLTKEHQIQVLHGIKGLCPHRTSISSETSALNGVEGNRAFFFLLHKHQKHNKTKTKFRKFPLLQSFMIILVWPGHPSELNGWTMVKGPGLGFQKLQYGSCPRLCCIRSHSPADQHWSTKMMISFICSCRNKK
jgi:hypothetical protein